MNGDSWFSFLMERLPELWLRTGEHLMLTGISTATAIVIGIPLGICAARIRWLRGPLTGGVGILQTIPSLAMLAILLALLNKIGAVPAIIALTLYALLPIVRNTLAGLQGVEPAVVEAARGIGMTPSQRLVLVEVPLAMPVILAGIRTAAVVSVGIATLSAFIGAGGLGQFINRGLALSNTHLILLGAIPAAILALIVDGSIEAFQWGLRRDRKRGTPLKAAIDKILRPVALGMPIILIVAGYSAFYSSQTISSASAGGSTGEKRPIVVIGSKNFTEQFILSQLMAQLLEEKNNFLVDKRFNLGGTMICHGAIKSEEIDLYAEYTGTALTAILDQEVIADPEKALEKVKEEYEKNFDATWLSPFGFNNTYAITVRESFARSKNLETISDLREISESLTAGFTAEFVERPDGFPGLRQAYNLNFKEVLDLEPALMYQAIAKGEVDVICAFATDGRIAAYDLEPLRDDKKFFPPYEAAPVVRTEVLEKFPEIGETLNLLAGRIGDATMQEMNYEVDEKGRSPRAVALEFLEREGLVE
jgi:osmoprotectant transport system permease protein